MVEPTKRIPETERFRRKRDLIIDAAATVINERGAKGMTLFDVAESVGLSTTSVTYYFKRKEQLACACFAATLDRLEALVIDAATEPDPPRRVARFVNRHFDLLAAIRRGEARPMARLSDLRAMEDPLRGDLLERYFGIFRRIRLLLGDDGGREDWWLRTARTHVLVENLFWLPEWLPRYDVEDYDRVRHRFLELFERGLAPEGMVWAPAVRVLTDPEEEDGAKRNFLAAATKLINERGYRGASVDRIASELNVTKGSFYHHLDAKDDLVLACFRRSLATITQAQRVALTEPGSHFHRLATAAATLLNVQFDEQAPLLRTIALQALPMDVRLQVVDHSNRIARRFAGMMIDGISEGSVATIDPLVASQAVMAMVNASYELTGWAAKMPKDRAIAYYASTLFFGLYADRPRLG